MTDSAGSTITTREVLEANNAIQSIGDDTYWLCVTRTVQESKLFPVPAYMLLSYLMCYYRYPALLRKIQARMSPEEIGDRARSMGGKFGSLTGWAFPTFYLLGREILINFGMLTPQDCAEDVLTVTEFWRRFKLAYQREDGHLNAREFGQRCQNLPERWVQRFHADLLPCAGDDRLMKAAQGFLAAVSQYGFLVSCESRVTLNNSGPYKLAENREMIVRDFTDLAEGDYPWLDGAAAGIPYNSLTVTMELQDCHVYLMDDWGSFESRPELTGDRLAGIGLYTSDVLSGGFVPVGMESAARLAETFETLTEGFKRATVELWKTVSGWTRDQMMDAGAIVYFSICKDLAHMAGVYEVEDWMRVDERADRFRPLLNDEFGRDFLGSLVGLIDLPSQRISDYAMMQHNNRPVRYLSHLPSSVVGTKRRDGGMGVAAGSSHHPAKEDRYTTTEGVLTLADFNRRAHASAAAAQSEPSDSWIAWNGEDPAVAALYRQARAGSTLLAGEDGALSRDEIEARRGTRAV
jgi:hypothetical protein